MKYLLSILLLSVLNCGCGVKYPANWVEKMSPDDFICDEIAGKYSNPADEATAIRDYEERTNTTMKYMLGAENPNDSPNYFIISFTEKSELKNSIF